MRRLAAGALATALLGAAGPLRAQTNAEVNAGVQFNFSNPGARSLGMGGAFIALADDATAAYANPAGLTTLSQPEVSVEGRSWAYTHQFTDRGTLLDASTLAGLHDGDAKNTTNGLSFLSGVYPGRGWTLALYRHELGNFAASFTTQGVLNGGDQLLFPARNSLQLEVENLGLAAGHRFGDSLSVGAGISRFSLALDSLTQRYRIPYVDSQLENSQIQHGDATRLAFNLGLIWQATASWRFGAAFRQGPSFEFSARTVPGPLGGGSAIAADRRASFSVPGVIGAGASYRPTEAATVTLDYLRVQFSSLTAHLTNIFAYPYDTRPFHVDDANQLRLGLEYNFPVAGGHLAARLGGWYDPDHRIRYDGTELQFRALFRAGDDEIHSTVGLGWSGASFQVDGAFDYSRGVKTGALSTVVRF